MHFKHTIKTTFLLIFVSLFLFITSCEMEEETGTEPVITITSPNADQQIYRGMEVKITALLKGFTGYYSIDSVQMLINDSVVYTNDTETQSIQYLWETARYQQNSHSITIKVDYTDISPEYKEWNYFNARDYIDELQNKEEDTTQKATLSETVNVTLTAPLRGNPSLQFVTIPEATFSYKGKTIMLDSFQMSLFETTTAQYVEFLNAVGVNADGTYGNIRYYYPGKKSNIVHDGSQFTVKSGTDSLPVTNVSWLGAHNYCRWAGGRLPTQTEYYYASDPQTSYTLNNVAWFRGNSNGTIHEIGTKNANSYGIHDLLGNAAEWCLDWYTADIYPMAGDTLKNPVVPNLSGLKLYKGGHWNAQAFETNAEIRNSLKPASSSNYVGFRVLKPAN